MPVVAHLVAWLTLFCCLTSCRATTSFPLSPAHSLLLPVALPPVARRQTEVAPAAPPPLPGEREPSCSELRSMWRRMRRMGRQMEFTNEIPKMQDPFTASAMDRHGAGGRRRPSKYPDPNPYSSAAKQSSREQHHAVFQTEFVHTPKGQFGDVVREEQAYGGGASPNRVLGGAGETPGFHEFDDYPGNTARLVGGSGRLPGRFADASLPEESLGVYGTVVHTPEERARFRAKTRRPPEYGLSRYRTHWGDSTGIGRVPFRAAQPHTQYHYGSVVTHTGDRHPLGGFVEFPQEIGQRTPGAGIRVERIDKIALASKLKNSCLRVQNRTCKTDVDCFCNGGGQKLFCGGGRCRPLHKAFKYGKQKWGKSWITDPYESSLIGYGPKRDPTWPGPF